MNGPKTTKAPDFMAAAAAKWAEWKLVVIGAGIGLIAGPIISSFAGFQIRTSTAAATERAGIVEQQAMFCAERARAAQPAAGATTDWQARSTLARQWAVMPGASLADPDVVYACASRLGG